MKWTQHKEFPESIFCCATKSEVHAGIVRFNDRGMILSNAWEYRKVRRFMRRRFMENKSCDIHWGVQSFLEIPQESKSPKVTSKKRKKPLKSKELKNGEPQDTSVDENLEVL